MDDLPIIGIDTQGFTDLLAGAGARSLGTLLFCSVLFCIVAVVLSKTGTQLKEYNIVKRLSFSTRSFVEIFISLHFYQPYQRQQKILPSC